jgi:opacity protein-like surface antigen
VKRLLSLALLFALLLPSVSHAENPSLTIAGKRAKVVGKAALYGFGGGLVVGIASQAFKKKGKNIFLFGSLGLYAGIATGIYVISTSRGPAPYEGPDTYEDYGDFSKVKAPLSEGLVASRHEPFDAKKLELNVVKVEF